MAGDMDRGAGRKRDARRRRGDGDRVRIALGPLARAAFVVIVMAMHMHALAHGVHRCVPAEEYHAIGGELVVSNSLITAALRSPAHARAILDGVDQEDTEALRFGNIFHCAMLEPDAFAARYVVEPEWGDCRKTENKAKRDGWRESNTRTIISAEHASLATKMAASLRRRRLSDVFSGGEAELTLRWADEQTGLECRARVDYYVEELGLAIDLKSTMDASKNGFRHSVERYGYDRQEVHYTNALRAVGLPVNEFHFVPVEKFGIFAAAIFKMDRESSYNAAEEWRRGMELIARCHASGEWPGYPEEVQELSIRKWRS